MSPQLAEAAKSPDQETVRERAANEGRVFDALASVRLMRQDIERYGYVRSETKEQVFDEELTFVAEGINAPLETRFSLHMTDKGLVNVMGSPLQQTLEYGVLAAEVKARRDGRGYTYRRAVHNYHEGRLLEEMMASNDTNTLVSFSPFPQEALGEYGQSVVENDGFQPKRLMGFMYVYTKKSDTEMEVTSLSVDNSDLDVFRAVAARLGVEIPADVSSDDLLQYRYRAMLSEHDQMQLPKQLLSAYDQVHEAQFGIPVRAGRPIQNEVNAWEFIHSQPDLIMHYMSRLEQLALDNPDDTQAKQELTLSFWAALKDRLKTGHRPPEILSTRVSNPASVVLHAALLNAEMRRAYVGAVARQERLVGCGGALGGTSGVAAEGTENLLDLSPDKARDAIFGDKPESKANWKWKKGTCVIKKCPTRPGKTDVGPCSICKSCQDLFDHGQDPTK